MTSSPWTDSACPQGEHERVGTRANANTVFDAAVGGELLLECLELRAEHEPRGVEDDAQGFVDLIANERVLRGEVDKRD